MIKCVTSPQMFRFEQSLDYVFKLLISKTFDCVLGLGDCTAELKSQTLCCCLDVFNSLLSVTQQ